MRKHMVTAVLVVGLAFSFAACKKQEEKTQLPAGHPGMTDTQSGVPAGHPGMEGMKPAADMPKVERKVDVPKNIQASWKAVKLKIDDKSGKTPSKDYTVNVGSEVAVPNMDIIVKVLAFVPHFLMQEQKITSASNKPENPAAQVVITEKGKEIWKGWLYSKHPQIHPFEHPKVGVTLLEGISK